MTIEQASANPVTEGNRTILLPAAILDAHYRWAGEVAGCAWLEPEQLAKPLLARAKEVMDGINDSSFWTSTNPNHWIAYGLLYGTDTIVQTANALHTSGLLATQLEGGTGRTDLRLLDIGAGAGAATVGTLWWLATQELRPRIQVCLSDTNAVALECAQKLIKDVANALGLSISISTDVSTWPRSNEAVGEHDLIVASNVLKYVARENRALSQFAEQLIVALTTRGVGLVLESERQSNYLTLEMRKALVAKGDRIEIVAPCLQSCLQCPRSTGRNHKKNCLGRTRLVHEQSKGWRLIRSLRSVFNYEYMTRTHDDYPTAFSYILCARGLGLRPQAPAATLLSLPASARPQPPAAACVYHGDSLQTGPLNDHSLCCFDTVSVSAPSLVGWPKAPLCASEVKTIDRSKLVIRRRSS